MPLLPPRRLPRTRGDGPCLGRIVTAPLLAPPHPRGWTPDRGAHRQAVRGSPAPAGMDPHRHLPVRPAPGLPRTRGDGPRSARWRTAPSWAPPHPRGWTLGTIGDRNSSFWLPRTRGDGPLLGASSLRPSTAPPHPRGWTPILSCVSYRYRGSPAPAGMDLDDRCAACVAEWLPRTRGDGPDQQGASRHQDGAPPHPRGWTPGACGGSTRGAGSPAPAGMDPTLVCRAITPVRLPRTRGDGPCVHNEIVETMGGLPRTRGDGPHEVGTLLARLAAPPHPRGWTRRGTCS